MVLVNSQLASRRSFLWLATAGLFAPARKALAAPFPNISSFRNPGCGCCEKWVEHMQAAGFSVTMADDPNLAERKALLGVPDDLVGCHTATIGNYVIEGHVPADDIILFLAESPNALGLAVPGMPMGSPGMEMDGKKDAYQVMIFNTDGTRKIYADHS